MKRLLFLSIAGAFLLALPGAPLVWGKANVPLDRVQICTSKGEVRNIKAGRLRKELDKGGCRLTACAFNVLAGKQFIFQPKSACTPTKDARGFCVGFAPADVDAAGTTAIDVTPLCTNPH